MTSALNALLPHFPPDADIRDLLVRLVRALSFKPMA
jgi:hypothetical protein